MNQPSDPTRLDYRAAERAACNRFGVDSVMGQDGLVEMSGQATPGERACYYIDHAHTHDPIFIASAIDAMLTALTQTEDHSDLDAIKQALAIAQHEPWSCACIEFHATEYGDLPGERFVVELLHADVDLALVHRNRQIIIQALHEAD